MRKYLPLVFTAVFLVGCAPYINSYYLPESVEGYLSGHSKRTSDEPLWILERDGGAFYFSAGRDDAKKTTLRLTIQPLGLPGETSLSAQKREEASAQVNLIIVHFANLREGPSIITNNLKKSAERVKVVKGQYGTANRSSVEPTTNEVYLPVDHYLELSAFYESSDSDAYVVEWPEMIINGKLVRLPPIKYQWKSGMQVKFING